MEQFANTIKSEVDLNEEHEKYIKNFINNAQQFLCDKEKEIIFDDIQKEDLIDYQFTEIDDEKNKNTELLKDDKNSDKKFKEYTHYTNSMNEKEFDCVKELNNLDNKYINNQLFLMAVVKRNVKLVKLLTKLGYRPTLNDLVMALNSNYDIYNHIKNLLQPNDKILKNMHICSLFIKDPKIIDDLRPYNITLDIFPRISKYISEEDKKEILRCSTENYYMYSDVKYKNDIYCPIVTDLGPYAWLNGVSAYDQHGSLGHNSIIN